jgi:hypothetical protein
MRKRLPKTLPLIPLMTLINTDPIGLAEEGTTKDTREHQGVTTEVTEDHEEGIAVPQGPNPRRWMPMPPFVPR